MSGWHSLQGYLGYRPSGALGRLKAKKKQWFVFDERNCQLLFYKSEIEASTKAPQGNIELRSAAISLNMDDPNQFIIHSQGKDHIFTAETHESTMIWLLALQAKRDVFNNQLTLIVDEGAAQFKEKEELKRKESLPSDHELQQMIRRAMCAESSGGGDVNNAVCGGLLRSQSVREQRNSSPIPHHLHQRILHPTSVLYRQSIDLGSIKTAPGNGVELGGLFHRSRHCSGGSMPTTDSEDTDTSVGRTISASPCALDLAESPPLTSLNSPLFNKRNCLNNACTAPSCLLHPLTEHPSSDLQNSDPQLSHSAQTLDSLDEIPLSDSEKLQDIRVDLMSSKVELAKALNREAVLKEVVENKDNVIQHLEMQLKECQNRKQKTEESVSNGSALTSQRLQEKCRILQNQNRFLNEEVLKLSRMWQQEQMKFLQQNQKIHELEVELDRLKRDYVFLLQSSIRITGGDGPDVIEVPMYGGCRHKERVSRLLEEARKINPSLPSLEGMVKSGCHVDVFGFKHCYVDEGLLLHYLCSQLNQHYTGQLANSEQNQMRWKDLLRNCLTIKTLPRTKEVKRMVRSGIPNHLRTKVWRLLIHERVKDIEENRGSLYYSHLCSMISDSEVVTNHRRQISLDLFRTMPGNVHFNENEADGIKKMQEVLEAFCIHNPNVGYCQGMNFIVGMALLFLKPEDTFWFLVAITERYFPPHYFDQNLIGAQADQEVLKNLLQNKLPSVSRHLSTMDIELSTITLNWFLAIFFESVPFNTLLRLWDCFLYEGPKVLFRFSLAIFKMNEIPLMQGSSTISIMRQLKASTKLCYDVEGLMRTAFEDLKPFPHRAEIITKQACYLKTLKEKFRKRNMEKEAAENKEKMLEGLSGNDGTAFTIECAVVYGEHIYVCEGQQNRGRIMKVSCVDGSKHWLNVQFESRIMCVCAVPDVDLLVIGTLSRFVYAYHLPDRDIAWQAPLNDAVLSICSYSESDKQRLYAALADGTVAILEWPKSSNEARVQREMFYIMIGSGSVTCLSMVENRLWCACGNRIVILHAKTLDTIDQFTVSASPLDVIASMTEGKHGVWVLLRGLTLFQLWDPQNLVCRMMFDIKENRCPRVVRENSFGDVCRVTAILQCDNLLWLGTGDGHVFLYDILLIPSCKPSAFNSPCQRETMDLTSMEQVTERIQELYLQQAYPFNERLLDFEDSLKQQRGRSDSGYQTVGDASSTIPFCRNHVYEADGTFGRSTVTKDAIGDGYVTSSTSVTLRGSGSTSTETSPPVIIPNQNEKSVPLFPMLACCNSPVASLVPLSISRLQSGGARDAREHSSGCSTPTRARKAKDWNSDGLCGSETDDRRQRRHRMPRRNRRKKNDMGHLRHSKRFVTAPMKQRHALSDVEPTNQCHRPLVQKAEQRSCLRHSFNDITHLLPSGDSLLSFSACDSFDFDDVFVTHTEDERWVDRLQTDRHGSLSDSGIPSTRSSKPKMTLPLISFNCDEDTDLIQQVVSSEAFATAEWSSSGVDEVAHVPHRRCQKHVGVGPQDVGSNSSLHVANLQTLQVESAKKKSMSYLDCFRGISEEEGTHQTKILQRRFSSASSLQDLSSPMSRVEYDSVQDSQNPTRLTIASKATPSNWKGSDSGSFVSFCESEVPYNFELLLREKRKISDRAIRCLLTFPHHVEPVMVSCCGSCNDPDGILEWTQNHSKTSDLRTWESRSISSASRTFHGLPVVTTATLTTTSPEPASSPASSLMHATSSLVGNSLAKVQTIITHLSSEGPGPVS